MQTEGRRTSCAAPFGSGNIACSCGSGIENTRTGTGNGNGNGNGNGKSPRADHYVSSFAQKSNPSIRRRSSFTQTSSGTASNGPILRNRSNTCIAKGLR